MKQNYEKTAAELLAEHGVTQERGLTAQEASSRLELYGPNAFEKEKKTKLIVKILAQLKDVSVIILLIAAVLSLTMAIIEWEGLHSLIEPLVVFAVIVMNVILAVTQERSAENALEALGNLSSPVCRVLRDGSVGECDPKHLVPGDIILLRTGDLVPADARLLKSESLAVDESSLTGESVPAEKDADAQLEGDIPLGDRANMVFSGCLVTAGNAVAIVTETGMQTQIGKIARFLTETKQKKTPLQVRLDKVGKIISGIAVMSAIVLFVVSLIQNGGILTMDMIIVAITLAIICLLFVVQIAITLLPTAADHAFGGMYVNTPVASVVKTLMSAGTLLVFLFSKKWLEEKHEIAQGEFYFLTLSTLLGMYFMVSSGHFLMFYLGIELASIPLLLGRSRCQVHPQRFLCQRGFALRDVAALRGNRNALFQRYADSADGYASANRGDDPVRYRAVLQDVPDSLPFVDGRCLPRGSDPGFGLPLGGIQDGGGSYLVHDFLQGVRGDGRKLETGAVHHYHPQHHDCQRVLHDGLHVCQYRGLRGRRLGGTPMREHGNFFVQRPLQDEPLAERADDVRLVLLGGHSSVCRFLQQVLHLCFGGAARILYLGADCFAQHDYLSVLLPVDCPRHVHHAQRQPAAQFPFGQLQPHRDGCLLLRYRAFGYRQLLLQQVR